MHILANIRPKISIKTSLISSSRFSDFWGVMWLGQSKNMKPFPQRYFWSEQKIWLRWIFDFFLAIYSTKTCQSCDFRYFVNLNALSAPLKFCELSKILCAKCQVKRSKNKGRVEFWRLYFLSSAENTVFLHIICSDDGPSNV